MLKPSDHLTLETHPSSGYKERTLVNARSADVTVAIAADFSTAGEKLTRNSASLYIALDIQQPALENARRLYAFLRHHQCRSLNIAGNGIYTLAKYHCAEANKPWDQRHVDAYIHRILALCHQHWPLTAVRSGGQTGADEAGLVAAIALEIPANGLLPKGYKQRNIDNLDIYRKPEELATELTARAMIINNG